MSWVFASCLGILSHYDEKDPSAKRYKEILVGMREAVSKSTPMVGSPEMNMNSDQRAERSQTDVDQPGQLKSRQETSGYRTPLNSVSNQPSSPYYGARDLNKPQSGVMTPSFFDITDLDLAVNLNNWSFSGLSEDAPPNSEAALKEVLDILGPFPGVTLNYGF